MADGFYRSKDPTNSIKVLKEKLERKTTQINTKQTQKTPETRQLMSDSEIHINDETCFLLPGHRSWLAVPFAGQRPSPSQSASDFSAVSQHTMTNMWRLVSRTWYGASTSITHQLLSAHVTQWRYINRKPEVLVLSMGVIVDLEEHMASLNDSYFCLTVKSNGLL